MDFHDVASVLSRLRTNVETVLLGKRDEVDLALASFLAGGHILLEDIPGTGKTTLARAVSASISGNFRRIQFTSDLLPQDVLGVHVFDADKKSFTFSPGPLFANIVLADEINRGNTRAQSALLEAMSERQVTVDNRTYRCPTRSSSSPRRTRTSSTARTRSPNRRWTVSISASSSTTRTGNRNCGSSGRTRSS